VFDPQLEVNPDLYLESILNVTKFGMNYSFGRLHTKVNKSEWITHGRPAIVNAFYSSIENSIRKYTFRISLIWTIKSKTTVVYTVLCFCSRISCWHPARSILQQ
jgi:hypothetical protein